LTSAAARPWGFPIANCRLPIERRPQWRVVFDVVIAIELPSPIGNQKS